MIEGQAKANSVIKSSLSSTKKVKIAIGGTNKISASVKSGGGTKYQEYDGDYDVTPMIDTSTTLETKDKIMTDNVTVKKIPVYEMTNTSGGKTVIIGGEFEYNG